MNGPAGGGSYSYTGYVEPTSAQRARTTELRDYYTTSWQGSAPRQRALDDYEAAKSAADSARMQKELAESEERSAWDRLYYNPSSPSRV
ncbi:hypothetical protein DIPPA_03735 [Diplonema papillatum]|nr:hypothetical protein DIPPA_03735 [Diplonema papillatum]